MAASADYTLTLNDVGKHDPFGSNLGHNGSDDANPRENSYFNLNAEDKYQKEGFSSDTTEVVYGPGIEKEFFEAEVQPKGHFTIPEDTWQQLLEKRNNRCLEKGSWEHIITDGVKQNNPYCVYIFKWHRVSTARLRARKSSSSLFSGEAICKFSHCKNHCKFTMDRNNVVHYNIDPQVKHKMNESHARPFRGPERDKMKDVFKHGQKPFKQYLSKMKETPKEVRVAGNFSNFGNTIRTFQQISSESRYEHTLDKSECESLLKNAEEMRQEIQGKKVHGFIKHISILPPIVLYWTELGIRIWHDLAKSSVVHWDATGSIINHRNDGYKYYYYELSCCNPTEGQPLIPVSGMISSLHSTPLVRFWLAEFRRQEKIIFGHPNTSIPRQVNSDRSLVFIQAALSEFNTESLDDFRNRSYRILTGIATESELVAMIPHACLSHVMGSFRKTCLEYYKSNYEFGMFCLSVLLNSSTLKDLKDSLKAIYFVLSSRYLDSVTINYLDSLKTKIAQIDIDLEMSAGKNVDEILESVDQVPDIFQEHENPNFLTEEDFNNRTTKNVFSNMGQTVLETVKCEIGSKDSCKDLPQNKRYSPNFAEKINTRYLPTVSIWSNLLLGDLSRHGTTEPYKNFVPTKMIVRGNSSIEKRFQIFKDIALSGTRTKRLDELSVRLKEHVLASQEYAVLKFVKPGKRSTARKGKSTKTIEETWDKRNVTGKENRTTGKYQKPPTKEKLKNLFDDSMKAPKQILLRRKYKDEPKCRRHTCTKEGKHK